MCLENASSNYVDDMKVISLAKFAKRLLVDLPNDCFFWCSFYLRRNRKCDEIVSTLEEEGVSFFELEEGELTSLFKVCDDVGLEEALEQSGQQKGRVYRHGLIDDRLEPMVSRFAAVAGSYLNVADPNLELTYFQESRRVTNTNDIPGGEFHLDDNKPNLKFFVYLSDVDATSGPFVLVPRSHGFALSRIGRYVRWSLFKRRSDLYCNTSEVAGLESIAVEMTGKKGSCFVADTTAWHRAMPVIDGSRKVFVASFNQ